MLSIISSEKSIAFDLICDGLSEIFPTEVIDSPRQDSKVILTNKIEFSEDPRSIFFTDTHYENYNSDWFCPSLFLANQMKCKVQYPFIKINKSSNKKTGIISSKENLSISKIAESLVYVHYPDDNNYVDWLSLASYFGTTVVTTNDERFKEFINPQTILVYNLDSNKSWETCIKMALKNAERNVMAIENNGRKWSNLDQLVRKIKLKQEKKELEKTLFRQIDKVITPSDLLQQRRTMALKLRTIPDISSETQERSFSFARKEYVIPNHSEMQTPEWFNSGHKNPKVSIIVPLFRSISEIKDQISNWDLVDDTNYEIIYVSDSCPQNSQIQVFNSWEQARNNYQISYIDKAYSFPDKIGRIIILSNNSGYATACNVGANYARGEILVFLNADTTPTQNWLKNIVKNIDKAGIIGNIQLKSDGTIDSAGSEWMEDSRSFDHIGRNVYKRKRLSKPFLFSNMPDDLRIFSPREMVTGCCFAIKKALFEEVGKFDIGYRFGYWEDSDLNMKVREAGYPIYIDPDSVIYHKCSHSQAGNHPYMADNANLFYDKWLRTGKMEKLLNEI